MGLYVGGLVSTLAEFGWGTVTESAFAFYVRFVMYYLPKKALFVIAGAKMAPRRRHAVTYALAAVAILMSLIVHVLGETTPGISNYTHFAAESVGAALGAAYMRFSSPSQRLGSP